MAGDSEAGRLRIEQPHVRLSLWGHVWPLAANCGQPMGTATHQVGKGAAAGTTHVGVTVPAALPGCLVNTTMMHSDHDGRLQRRPRSETPFYTWSALYPSRSRDDLSVGPFGNSLTYIIILCYPYSRNLPSDDTVALVSGDILRFLLQAAANRNYNLIYRLWDLVIALIRQCYISLIHQPTGEMRSCDQTKPVQAFI